MYLCIAILPDSFRNSLPNNNFDEYATPEELRIPENGITFTAFTWAVHQGLTDVVEYILKFNRCVLTETDSTGRTALTLATNAEIRDLIIKAEKRAEEQRRYERRCDLKKKEAALLQYNASIAKQKDEISKAKTANTASGTTVAETVTTATVSSLSSKSKK